MANKITKTLRNIGLAGILALSGCMEKVEFMDGPDSVKLTHIGTHTSVNGHIDIFVTKEDGTRVIYSGGKNPSSDPENIQKPILDNYKIISSNKTIFSQEPNQDAYNNFTNYIGIAERLGQLEIDGVLKK